MSPAFEDYPFILQQMEAIAEGAKFVYLFRGHAPARAFSAQQRVRLWNQPRPPADLYIHIGYGIVRSSYTLQFPQVLQFADKDLEVRRHNFSMTFTKEAWMTEMLEERFGRNAVDTGAPYTAIAIQAV